MPNNAAFTTGNVLFSGLNAKELIMSACFLHTGIIDNEIVDQLQEALLATNAA
jgi:hypothetical protein